MPRTDLYVNLPITGELAPFRIVAHDGSPTAGPMWP